MARLTVLDDAIKNPHKLHAVTLYATRQLDYTLYRYAAHTKKQGDTAIFWDDDIWAPEPATRKVAVVLDGTHVSIDRSGDKDRREVHYLDKKVFAISILTDTKKKDTVDRRNCIRRHP